MSELFIYGKHLTLAGRRTFTSKWGLCHNKNVQLHLYEADALAPGTAECDRAGVASKDRYELF